MNKKKYFTNKELISVKDFDNLIEGLLWAKSSSLKELATKIKACNSGNYSYKLKLLNEISQQSKNFQNLIDYSPDFFNYSSVELIRKVEKQTKELKIEISRLKHKLNKRDGSQKVKKANTKLNSLVINMNRIAKILEDLTRFT